MLSQDLPMSHYVVCLSTPPPRFFPQPPYSQYSIAIRVRYGFAILTHDVCPSLCFQAYAHLKRLGYVVYRHRALSDAGCTVSSRQGPSDENFAAESPAPAPPSGWLLGLVGSVTGLATSAVSMAALLLPVRSFGHSSSRVSAFFAGFHGPSRPYSRVGRCRCRAHRCTRCRGRTG